MKKIAIVGASDNPERYSYKAQKALISHGYEVVPITPKLAEVQGVKAYKNLRDFSQKLSAVTMYVGESISLRMLDEIVSHQPDMVIFNPGAENPVLERQLAENGIKTIQACTLVLLSTDQFEDVLTGK